jgi:hypothetical protein
VGSKVRDGEMNSCICPLFQVTPVWLKLTAAFILLGLAYVAEINSCTVFLSVIALHELGHEVIYRS